MSSFTTTSPGVRLRPAEAVAAGHPDKIADAIADAIVDLAIGREPRALVGVEVAVHRGSVFVTGRAAGARLTQGDIDRLVRERYAVLGHGGDWPPDPAALGIVCDLDLGPLVQGEADFREVSDDQSICTGYAVDSPATGWLPPEHWLAHRIVRGLEALRAGEPGLRLGPDAKAAVLGAETPGRPMALEAASVSLQQAVGGDEIATRRRVVEVVRAALEAAPGAFEVPSDLADADPRQRGRQLRVRRPERRQRPVGQEARRRRLRAAGPDRGRGAVGQGLLQGGPRGGDRGPAAGARDRAGRGSARGHRGAAVAPGRPRGAGGRRDRPGGEAIDPGPWLAAVDLSLRGSGNGWPALVRGQLPRLAVEGHFGGDQPWER